MKYYDVLMDCLQYEGPHLLLSGGIGDFLVIESFTTDYEWESIKTFINGTSSPIHIDLLLKAIPMFKPKTTICLHRENVPKRTYDHVAIKLRGCNIPAIRHYNFWLFQKAIGRRNRKYRGSSFLTRDLPCDISRFNLPKEYVVIFPSTSNHILVHKRNFQVADWDASKNILTNYGLPGVIIGHPERQNEMEGFINLTGKTSVVEAIMILRESQGYIGVDSFLSVLAAKCFNCILAIKSVNSHAYIYKDIYFAGAKIPYEKFLVPEISKVFRATLL